MKQEAHDHSLVVDRCPVQEIHSLDVSGHSPEERSDLLVLKPDLSLRLNNETVLFQVSRVCGINIEQDMPNLAKKANLKIWSFSRV